MHTAFVQRSIMVAHAWIGPTALGVPNNIERPHGEVLDGYSLQAIVQTDQQNVRIIRDRQLHCCKFGIAELCGIPEAF